MFDATAEIALKGSVSMLRVTALGNHGWLVEGGHSRLLIDPTLTDRPGATPAMELRVYPPRRIDVARFPAVDAVFLSHERDGHFEPASLHLLDRAIPIYISPRSSLAMRTAIEEMGFAVRVAHPDTPITAGEELELVPIVGNQMTESALKLDALGDEWDNLGCLVFDRAGHGSFFTTVANSPGDRSRDVARRFVSRPGLWAVTSNEAAVRFDKAWARLDSHRGVAAARAALDEYRELEHAWAAPEALLLVGSGLAFGGERSWLNTSIYEARLDEIAASMTTILEAESQRVLWPIPGQTLTMRNGRLVDEMATTDFASALPRDEWPPRAAGSVKWLEDYEPLTGRRDLGSEELAALEPELEALAVHLYGTLPFRRLYSLTANDLKGRKPTLALVLRADPQGASFVYRYEPQRCTFSRVASDDPTAEYVMVYECWGADLLAALRAEISVRSLSLGFSRQWAAIAEPFDLNETLIQYVHPLRMQQRFLTTYRRTIRALREPGARIARNRN